MRPNRPAFDAQTARGAAFGCDTHISAPRARTIASSPTNVRRGMRSASRSTGHSTHPGSTAGHDHMHASEAPRAHEPTTHRREPRRGRISTGNLVTNEHARTQMLFGATDRVRGVILPRTSTKTANRVVGEDVGGSLQHAPSMDSMTA
jgi:hypothetical protein